MMPVRFDKERAQEILNSLTNGQPIAPPSTGQWSVLDMLTLAGGCFFGVFSHGSPLHQSNNIDVDDLHSERREAVQATLFHDIHAAIEFLGHLMELTYHEEFDESFESPVEAVVTQEGQVERRLQPVKGFRAV